MYAFAHPQRSGMNDAWTREGVGRFRSEESIRVRAFSCGRVAYARVSGPLELTAAAPFKQQIQRLLDTGCRALILDLSGVQFVDSEGVRALLSVRDEAEKRRARLRVVVPPGSPVERTLRLLRFDSLFSIFRSAAAAWKRQFSGESRAGRMGVDNGGTRRPGS
jgi:anti-anti-sigma factor